MPRVFLGAQLLGAAADRRAAATELGERSNAEISAWLSADSGYTELGELEADRAEHVGAAYRHDCVSATPLFRRDPGQPAVGTTCPRRSPLWSLRMTLQRRGSGHTTATGSCWPNTSSCTSSPAAVTTSPHSSGRRRRRPSCGPPECWLLDNRPTELKGAGMSSSPLASLLDVELQRGKPPILRAEATGDAPAGRPSTGTRCAPSWQSTARFWFAALGCVTPPRPLQSSDGWPPP